jgi:Leucine-rich repeat (LRR) protein
MKYSEFLNESKETDNLWLLIDNDDPSSVALGLAMATNYKSDFKKCYNCKVEDYTELHEWLIENDIRIDNKASNPITNVKSWALHIVNKDISSIPESIYCMKYIQEIVIIDCPNLTELPDNITTLKYLKHLEIQDCPGITELPKDIGKLSKLKKLEIMFCSLTTVPDSIGDIKYLETFDVRKNKISSYPDSLKKCTKLKYVTSFGNKCNLSQSLLPDKLVVNM